MAAITIRGLTKSFPSQAAEMAAVDALDLDISDNQFVTLLGPSGCGKTTTLRLIAGFLRPDAGTIQVGKRLLSSPAGIVTPENRGMGMVFQNYAVWPHKTVFENVAFGLRIRKLAAAKIAQSVEKTLELVNLGGLESRIPSELSGGQQQRVALARSLVVEPEILLLDEPLSNLDAKLRERMRSELKQLQRRTGITFIYVTHDQAEAMALSDQVAVIHGGRLQQVGTPIDVYCAPANKLVANFMGLVNVLPGTIAKTPADGVRIDSEGGVVLDVPVPPQYGDGDAVDLIVRPESIRIVPAGAAGVAHLPATVIEQVFLGNINEIHVTLKSGRRLQIQTSPHQRFATGDSVGAAINADQCSIFRR